MDDKSNERLNDRLNAKLDAKLDQLDNIWDNSVYVGKSLLTSFARLLFMPFAVKWAGILGFSLFNEAWSYVEQAWEGKKKKGGKQAVLEKPDEPLKPEEIEKFKKFTPDEVRAHLNKQLSLAEKHEFFNVLLPKQQEDYFEEMKKLALPPRESYAVYALIKKKAHDNAKNPVNSIWQYAHWTKAEIDHATEYYYEGLGDFQRALISTAQYVTLFRGTLMEMGDKDSYVDRYIRNALNKTGIYSPNREK